jgi:hypothetical protein
MPRTRYAHNLLEKISDDDMGRWSPPPKMVGVALRVGATYHGRHSEPLKD